MDRKTPPSLKEQIDRDRVPKHVAIIMDGNGRWAQERGEERTFGHIEGRKKVREVLQAANSIGVEVLTLYTFSEENWNRPKEEVNALMELLVTSLVEEIDTLMENDIRLDAIGAINGLPEVALEKLTGAMVATKANKRARLVLALNYSGRSEMVHAFNLLRKEHQGGEKEINEQDICKALYAPDLPDLDLMIRTGGEQRVSNFLLWQLAYAELYFTPCYWPAFGEEEFYKAIIDFQGRQRRFGKTGEQIEQCEE